MLLGFNQLFTDTKNFVADSLFPMYCLGCEVEGNFLCDMCSIQLEMANQQCIVCHKLSIDGATHDRCQTKLGVDKLYSVFDYHDDLVSKLIIYGKYKFLPEVYKNLGSLMAQNIACNLLKLGKIDAVVPIPLHRFRMRWRGFNQSEILAEQISTELGVPIIYYLTRIKNTKVQKDLGEEKIRKENIRDAFYLNDSVNIQNLNIAIVDDVITTGSTLKEATKLLKDAGANKVICLTLARD